MQIPHTLKNRTDDPTMVLLSIYPKEFKAGSQRGIDMLMFTAALFTIAKRWGQLIALLHFTNVVFCFFETNSRFVATPR